MCSRSASLTGIHLERSRSPAEPHAWFDCADLWNDDSPERRDLSRHREAVVASLELRRYAGGMTAWMAEEAVTFVTARGDRIPGTIAVAAPAENEENCSCVVALEGLERARPIYGATTLQALLLGLQHLADRLDDFVAKGGRVCGAPDPSDPAAEQTDALLAAVFGRLLQHPSWASAYAEYCARTADEPSE